MSVNLQIICIILSFIYGMFIYITNIINKKINGNKEVIINTLINIIYIYIMVLLYVIIIYKINKGIFHYYFFMVMLIGYIIMSNIVKKLKKHVKLFKMLNKK